MNSGYSLINKSQNKISLDSLTVFDEYVPILVTYTKEDAAINGLRVASSSDNGLEESHYFSALEVLSRDKQIILKAPSGMGKSFFLKMLARCMTGEVSGDKKFNVDRITESIERTETDGLPEKQNWDAGVLKPFIFELNIWAHNKDSIHNLPEEINKAQLVLIDGIDELQNEDWQWISTELQSFFEKNPETYAVIVGQNDMLDRLSPKLKGFKCYSIKPFTYSQKKRLFRNINPDLSCSEIENRLSEPVGSLGNLLEITQNLSWWIKIGKKPTTVQSFYSEVVRFLLQQENFDADQLKSSAYKKLCDQKIEINIVSKYHTILDHTILLEYFACQYCLGDDFSTHFNNLIGHNQNRAWSLSRILHLVISEQDPDKFQTLSSELCPSEDPSENNKSLSLSAILSANLLFEAFLNKMFIQDKSSKRIKDWLTAIITKGWLTPYDRITAGRLLSWMGDDRDFQEFVIIPENSFTMGDHFLENNMPVHQVHLQSYKICKFPVVNKDYLLFVKETNREWNSPERDDPEKRNYPATSLTWFDAVAYCEWLTEKWRKEGVISSKEFVRLPTEAEWEYASRGSLDSSNNELLYSWGYGWKDNCCNSQELGLNEPCTVGIFPENCSQFGCLDMNGLVWEWNSTLWGNNPKKPDFPYPYNDKDGRENSKNAPNNIRRCMRGGSFGSAADHATSTYRGGLEPIGFWRGDGFRIVISEKQYHE